MVSLFNTLPCSFRGVPFLWKDISLFFGRKTIPFEFVNKNHRYVQDVGGLLRTYDVTGIITGNDYLATRKAFIAAINKPGIGIFQHPFDGPIKVVADPATLNEKISDFGICEINVLFREARNNIYPQEAADNRSFINKLTGDVLSQVESAVEDLYNVTSTFSENIEDAQQTLANVVSIAQTVTKPFTTASSFLSGFSNTLSNFTKEIGKAVRQPALLAANITQLMGSLNNLASDPLSRFNLNSQMFRAGANAPLFLPPTATAKSKERQLNRTSINSQVNFDALANAYAASVNIDYVDETQLLSLSQKLEDQFQYTINMTQWDSQYTTRIFDLRNQMRVFIENSRINIKKLVPYNASKQTITNVSFAFYNNLNNDQLLMNINDITTPNNIQGDIFIVTP